jgi:hypothetical protein
MSVLRRSFLIGLALVAAPLPAAAQDMCAALNRIAAAAREAVPFASLSDGQLVPGYHYCRVQTGTAARAGEVFCHQQLAPKSLIAGTVGAQVRECLGAVPISIPRRYPSSTLVYGTDELWISVESHCDERCHVGRLASLAIRRRREGETAPPQ